mmetsp:Transcript_54056/g.161082  ORF Transcript_54056/g.161082 Transcript_54056/m.161082 type:complete len:248 (-) Transcript_54056:732-1475(-)
MAATCRSPERSASRAPQTGLVLRLSGPSLAFWLAGGARTNIPTTWMAPAQIQSRDKAQVRRLASARGSASGGLAAEGSRDGRGEPACSCGPCPAAASGPEGLAGLDGAEGLEGGSSPSLRESGSSGSMWSTSKYSSVRSLLGIVERSSELKSRKGKPLYNSQAPCSTKASDNEPRTPASLRCSRRNQDRTPTAMGASWPIRSTAATSALGWPPSFMSSLRSPTAKTCRPRRLPTVEIGFRPDDLPTM